MADKKKLDQMMQKRTGPRQVVQPEKLYGEEQTASKPVNQRTSEEENQQNGKAAKKSADKPVKKFATYLRPASIRALKRIAIDTERNDYEVLQQAVDEFLAKQGMGESKKE